MSADLTPINIIKIQAWKGEEGKGIQGMNGL